MQSEELSEYQKQIIEKLYTDSVMNINCRNPGKQLGDIASGNDGELYMALVSLEDDFGALEMHHAKSLFWDKSSYGVNRTRIKELFNSLELGK